MLEAEQNLFKSYVTFIAAPRGGFIATHVENSHKVVSILDFI